jgi:pyruvate/2-oxoglutarate dehydrogenase complex dihydrolipoamide dehydrogenase (E3) component
VRFEFLAAPVRLMGDEHGLLREMESIRMQLGEPDESGRPAPVPIAGSEYRQAVDTVVMTIGQSPNPTVQRTTSELLTNRGKIVIDNLGQNSIKNVFAGGDVVRGGSTVILAMRDGRAAAEAIDRALRAEARINPHPRKREVNSANRIVARRCLAPEVAWLEVEAPEIAQHWKAGQFVIVRPTPTSERMPLTIVAGDARLGTIKLVVQAVGRTSHEMVSLATGNRIAGILGTAGPSSYDPEVWRRFVRRRWRWHCRGASCGPCI